MGFEECKVTNGVYTHRERDLRSVTHVDDFLLSGEEQHLIWFRNQMQKIYELKVQVAGWEREDNKELSFLGRVIRTTPMGIELEGDDKHVEMLEEEWDMVNCNPVATPYVKPAVSIHGAAGETDTKPMRPADATLYRRAAARINYVALDRPDLSFASRVASSHMSNPKEGSTLKESRGWLFGTGSKTSPRRLRYSPTRTGLETRLRERAQVEVWSAEAATR